jgi:hypothetical protein
VVPPPIDMDFPHIASDHPDFGPALDGKSLSSGKLF